MSSFLHIPRTQWHRGNIPFPQGRNCGHSMKRSNPKQDRNLEGKNASSYRSLLSIWDPNGIGLQKDWRAPPLQLCCQCIALLIGWLYSTAEVFLGICPMTQASFWTFHFNSGFTFPVLCNGLSGSSYRESDTVGHSLASAASLNFGTNFQKSSLLAYFTPVTPVPHGWWCHGLLSGWDAASSP